MAQQVYPPNVIINTIRNGFFRYRDFTAAPRSLAQGVEISTFDDDRIVSDMEQFHYVRLDALRNVARGRRDWVIIIVLNTNGKYFNHSPDLRKLIDSIDSERPTKEGRLDEVIIVVEKEFFDKKQLTNVIADFQKKQAGGPDHEGNAPFYSVYPYDIFSCIIPENINVVPHRIMSQSEVDEFLRREYISRSSIPVIYNNDPPVVWIGGREGQVVEIMRYSPTSGRTPYYRRIERILIQK